MATLPPQAQVPMPLPLPNVLATIDSFNQTAYNLVKNIPILGTLVPPPPITLSQIVIASPPMRAHEPNPQGHETIVV